MTKSETMAELQAEDIAKMNEARMGYGCLSLIAVPAALVFLFFLFIINWKNIFSSDSAIMAAVTGVLLVVLYAVYKFIRKNDAQIEKDIFGGQKKIIIAPITNKTIKSSDITHGRQKGGIASKYFMTIAGRDYPMTETKYLTIPVGEFMEIHQAPASKTVLLERWLKKDGTVGEAGDATQD